MKRLVIPGEPVAKGRPRVTIRGGHARAYTPARTERWEGIAATLLRAQAGPGPPMDGPVVLLVWAVFRRPARLNRKKDPPWRLWHPARPDVDNVLKAVMDALVLGGLLHDDAQVTEVTALSVYAAKGEDPCVELHMSPATDWPEGA